jgi:hypothetical protein
MTIKEKVIEYINSNDVSDLSNGKLAIKLNKELNLEYENLDTLRRNLTNWREQTQQTTTPQYNIKKVGFPAINDSGLMMDIDEYCEYYKIPRKDVKSYKLITHTGPPYFNIVFYPKEESMGLMEESLLAIVEKIVSRDKPIQKKRLFVSHNKAIRLIYSDVHIGMTTNANGHSLYGGKWDEEEVMSRCNAMIESLLDECRSEKINEVYIDDLGDFMDGWNGLTTRGGHDLPQNMDNEKAFDVGVRFKVHLVDSLYNSGIIDRVICNNVTEDNHSGSFGYVVNQSAKQILERDYSGNFLEYNVHRKFISTYGIGKHGFLICHGKDSKNLKFGFKPKLDDKGSEKISQFIRSEKLASKYEFIEFSKGDSHQALFDYATSDEFDYFNIPALSPSSEWVQVNFKKGRSGFVMQVIDKDKNYKKVIPVWFDWAN